LMGLYSMDAEEAKIQLRHEIKRREEAFKAEKNTLIAGGSINSAQMRWLQMLELTVAGTSLWSANSCRYDPTGPVPVRPSHRS